MLVFFAGSYLNEFVTKQCKTITFYGMKFNKHVKIVQKP